MHEYHMYLAGPIQGTTWTETNSWRKYVTENVSNNIKALSPLRGKEPYLSTLPGTGDSSKIGPPSLEYPLSTPAAILGRDRWDATRSDILFVNLLGATKVSIGTVMEIAWADAARVPIMLVMEDTGNVHDHSMLVGVVSWRVNNLDTAIDLVNKILL